MTYGISKSRFQKGLQCEKALWLGVHRRDLASPVSESTQWVFDQGHEVGRLAQQLFPGGIEVAEDHLHQAEALATTRRLLAEDATVLYEPAFEHETAFARVDILVATGDGRFDLYEVKSSSALKDVHITDAAVQAWTVEGAGLTVRSVNVVHLNTAYIYPGGEYDVASLFTIEDVTEMAREFMPSVPATLARFQEMLAGPEPQVACGLQCSKPYGCDYEEYCRSLLPEEPAPSGEPRIDADGLSRELERLVWPVLHLDFETIMPALPLWPGTHPYQALPFQYSLHIHDRDGSTEHREYLHLGTDDPRRDLTERLLADLGETGSIVHYSSYERTTLRGLAAALPDLAPAIEAVLARLYDLAPVIKRHARHPATGSSWSIKSVLPAWCPDLSYADLAIGDGQTASVRYLRILKGETQGADADAVRADLTEYCALDTLAMVRLLEEMVRLSRGEA